MPSCCTRAPSGADLAQALSAYGARLSQPITFGSRTVPLQPRVGVVLWPGDGHAAAELLRRVDIALVMATDLGSTAPVWFEFRMEAMVTDRALMSRAIDRALRDGEFELFYQPGVDPFNGRIDRNSNDNLVNVGASAR